MAKHTTNQQRRYINHQQILEMKTYIIDWGKKSKGGRYALTQTKNIAEAFWQADEVGAPFDIAELIIPTDEDGQVYMEISQPKSKSAGNKIKKVMKNSKSSCQLFKTMKITLNQNL